MNNAGGGGQSFRLYRSSFNYLKKFAPGQKLFLEILKSLNQLWLIYLFILC